ncbi:30S ribosomal protein S9 [Candidatus Adlerbacteria bacterium RIFCSPHIGHO2_01_FULL_54_23]|uniref:30S ribosomal protein S9 n=3 Tax=Candidatus Adleribacteriota TaxID=1752736 RepID=A0A1F4Y162_9BACT|nr:MAG: 30S ribosomal protein S9 [Candidatus Adlerbacteria bacterium GW2011_GWA1_54_10]KKW37971.1 MAG: 30S ribosomal protein S9 [Candidatus Adlerbacteria bacterium GW2011_GWB1_54_7]OGC78579.1 MAG: 30S ribosomal protein S9 [Candidatus Adlerbacteria bacterium RIFCSPHIGHO2_01_FULL_54_23]OGC87588.1 MAG: 30S ribosomal protein S9 [Candidatus Adlerbacteria bacterium RIFCSPLOWO2_01_FULL_54_16]
MATKTKEERYIEAVGRRKTSIARARLVSASRTAVVINGKNANEYFTTEPLRVMALEPFLKVTLPEQFTVTVKVTGGGIAGQAAAVRHAISRALNAYDKNLRGALKKEGFLARDARAKERRKPGLVKARKRKQWSKR